MKKSKHLIKRITAFAAAVAMSATFCVPSEVGDGIFGIGNAVVASAYNAVLDIRNGDITISSNGSYLIQGGGVKVQNRIIVKKDVSAEITLDNVKINLTKKTIDVVSPEEEDKPAFLIEDGSKGDVTLILIGNNTLTSNRNLYDSAGLQKNGDENTGTLTIKGTGSLEVKGSMYAAGIGGAKDNSASNIVIESGTINAYSGYNWGGAGIGGGQNGDGSNITINGGTVNAVSDVSGAGIGGGQGRKGSNITITGGTVTATGDDYGIGSARGVAGSDIIITGGSVKANKINGTIKDTNGNNAYCLTVENPNNETVLIDGVRYTPSQHSNTDTNIYVYLPDLGATPHIVKVGGSAEKYYVYKSSEKKWVERADVARIELSGLSAPQPKEHTSVAGRNIHFNYDGWMLEFTVWRNENGDDVTYADFDEKLTFWATVKPADQFHQFDEDNTVVIVNGQAARITHIEPTLLTFAVDVQTRKAEVTGLTIESLPAKTKYFMGDGLDIYGCKVNATYEDGSTKVLTVNSNWVSDFDTSTVGDKIATITYDNPTIADASTTFSYTVKPVGTLSGGYYQLSTEEDLKWFSEYVNDGHFSAKGILLNDITVTSDWTPIGTSADPYMGTFDGAGYTISGLTVNNSSADNIGLFGYISNGTVKKLRISGASFKGNENVGAVCGYNNGGTISECCVSDSTISGASNVGGIAGYSSGDILNCCNSANVSGSGIVGNGSDVNISSCLNLGKVTVDNIAGSGTATISNCYYNKELSDVTGGKGTGKTTLELTDDSLSMGDAWEKTANDYSARKLNYPNLVNINADAPYVAYEPSLKITNTNTGNIKYGDEMTFTFDAVLKIDGKEISVTPQINPINLSGLQFNIEHNGQTLTFTTDYSTVLTDGKLKLILHDKEAGYFSFDTVSQKVIVVITEKFDAGTHTLNVDYTGDAIPVFKGANGSCTVTIVQGNVSTVTTPSVENELNYGEPLSNAVLDNDEWSWVDDSVIPAVNNNGYEAYIPVDDSNYDYSGVSGYSPAKHAVIRAIPVTVKPAVPAIVVSASPEAEIPGRTITVGAVVSNPNNSKLTDYPGVVLTYRIGSGAEQSITGGSFVIPEDTAIGAVITVTASTPAADNYAVGTDSTVIMVTACEHANKTLKYSENAHWYYCSDCGADIGREAHSGGLATCTEKAACLVCGQLYGSPDSNYHTSLSTVWSTDVTGHWHECADCHARVDKAEHISDGPAAADKAERCTVCSFEINPALGSVAAPRIQPGGGRFNKEVTVTIECPSQDASIYYTTDGSDPAVNGKVYTGAFTLYSDAKVRAITKKSGLHDSYETTADFVIIDLDDHTHHMLSEWKYNDTMHWHECECGKRTDAEQHISDDGVVTVEPTADHDGVKTYYCTVCGCVLKTEPFSPDPITAFVYRLYKNILNRDADANKVTHIDNLNNGESACKVAYDFVFSHEFTELDISNEERVRRMYLTFLNRDPDPAGLANWVKSLDNGCSIGHVFYGFTQSKEFGEICEEYGITRGTWEYTENRDKSEELTAFVSRLYTKALNRKFDVNGLNDHTGSYLEDHDLYQMAYNFIFSQEFIEKNLSDEDFVDTMYRTFFDREADPDGRADWLGRLKSGCSREEVLAGFVGSQECADMVAKFGI
ncbi:MAG: DUF4214 domain-containing protein [Ruminococcus sp.]|nr:DUF4214 domain-containing protein [Ruminococcus sp.]